MCYWQILYVLIKNDREVKINDDNTCDSVITDAALFWSCYIKVNITAQSKATLLIYEKHMYFFDKPIKNRCCVINRLETGNLWSLRKI